MQALQLAVPAIATVALGAALLVPLRDERRGKRATFGTAGEAPLRVDFRALEWPDRFGKTIGKVASEATPEQNIRAAVLPIATDAYVSVNANADHANAKADASTGCFELQHDDACGTVSATDVSNDDSITSVAESATPTNALESATPTNVAESATPINVAESATPTKVAESPAPTSVALVHHETTILALIRTLRRRLFSASEKARIRMAPRGAGLANAVASADPIVSKVGLSFEQQLARRLSISATGVAAAAQHSDNITGDLVELAVSERAVEPTAPSANDPGPLVVRSQPAVFERAVPLTRLPLRSQTSTITWVGVADSARTTATRADRHALLHDLANAARESSIQALLLAYREEDAAGRLLAMRALMRTTTGREQAIFADALRTGTDEERALAIDALAATGAREALVRALSDRVEAIAAKAALAFVGTNVRADFRRALEPLVDHARIETVISLLAGYLE